MALEGFKLGFGAVMGGAVALLVLYMLNVLLPGTSSKRKIKW